MYTTNALCLLFWTVFPISHVFIYCTYYQKAAFSLQTTTMEYTVNNLVLHSPITHLMANNTSTLTNIITSDGAVDMIPPVPNLSDYILLTMLIILFTVGAPVNLVAFQQLNEQASSRLDRLLLLKQHLNYSDLLILFVYAPSKICWILTYSWRGGDALCRVIKFTHTLGFQVIIFITSIIQIYADQ
jgi:hypothetical protein